MFSAKSDYAVQNASCRWYTESSGGVFKESSSQSVELQLYKSKLVCHSRGPVPMCREAGIQLRHSSRNAKRVFVEQSGKTGFRNTVRNDTVVYYSF